jgi:hypothetical protein
MGRQAPKKYSKMNYFEKQAFTRDQAEKHGIELKHEIVNGRHEQVDWEASNAAVTKAMANDYDTRRSIEAAQLSGNKKANKLGKGINNIQDAVNAERFMAKTHVKKLGATGKYSSANDEGNVTNYWVNKDRDKLTSGMSVSEQQKDAAEPATKEEPYKPSKEMTDAREKVATWESGTYDKGIYASREQSTAPTSQQSSSPYQRSKGESQLDAFKSQLKERKNFQPSL